MSERLNVKTTHMHVHMAERGGPVNDTAVPLFSKFQMFYIFSKTLGGGPPDLQKNACQDCSTFSKGCALPSALYSQLRTNLRYLFCSLTSGRVTRLLCNYGDYLERSSASRVAS